MPQLKNLLRSTASTLLVALLTATAQADTTRREFDAALQKWQAAGIHDYSFTLFHSCFCPGGQPMRITVIGDTVQNAINVQDGTAVVGKSMDKPPTLTEVFQTIAEGYAKPADHITLTLNKDYGYPEHVFIDYYVMMADEELIYEIRDFSH